MPCEKGGGTRNIVVYLVFFINYHPVGLVDEILELLRRPIAGGGGEERGHLDFFLKK